MLFLPEFFPLLSSTSDQGGGDPGPKARNAAQPALLFEAVAHGEELDPGRTLQRVPKGIRIQLSPERKNEHRVIDTPLERPTYHGSR